MGTKEMAVISNVSFGTGGEQQAHLRFNVNMIDSRGALQILWGAKALEFIEENCISNITALEGAPCIVESNSERNTVEIVSLFTGHRKP